MGILDATERPVNHVQAGTFSFLTFVLINVYEITLEMIGITHKECRKFIFQF